MGRGWLRRRHRCRSSLAHLEECASLLLVAHDLGRHVDSHETAVDRIDDVRLTGSEPPSRWVEMLADTTVTRRETLDEFGQAASELDAHLNAEDHAP